MIKNYIKIAFRNFLKERQYSFINIFGLAIAFTTCFFIYSWIKHEMSYDKFHKDAGLIYRINTKTIGQQEQGLATTYPVVKTLILDQIPEITNTVRIYNTGLFGSVVKVTYGNKIFTNDRFYYGDSTFFDIFSYKILYGDSKNPLSRPNSVVITKSTAEKYFGQEDPIGKLLIIGEGREFEVTVVVEDVPENSHFKFDILASMQSHPWISRVTQFGSGVVYGTYVKLQPGSTPNVVKEKIDDILFNQIFAGQEKPSQELVLQPLTDIHLKSHYEFEMEANGNIKYIYIFSLIVFLLLIIAAINYVNLATARSMRRAREIGVRKVMGAFRGQLIKQYLAESIILCFIAAILAIAFIELLKQPFQEITGKYGIINIYAFENLGLLIFISLGVGLFAGVFPALILSSFQPVKVLRGKFGNYSGRFSLRKALVVFQFAVSMVLILSTLVIYRQLNFMQDKKLGYNKDHVVVLNLTSTSFDYKLLKNELLNTSAIVNASAASQLPTNIQTGEGINIFNDEDRIEASTISIDRDFFKTMDLEMLEGNQAVENLKEDQYLNKYVINESVLNSIGFNSSEIVGREIKVRHGNMQFGPIIGVVKDFHFQSLHHPISNLIFEFDESLFQYLLIRVQPQHIEKTLESIKNTWHNVAGDIPFDYQFLDQEYNKLYLAELKMSRLFIAFGIMATLIASLGLFGLTALSVEKRVKEIGIRKVFGASIQQIIRLLSKDFSILILIAFVTAIPIALYLMDQWLENFAYKTTISFELIGLTGIMALLIAVLTVGYYSFKAARSNPVETLKYE